MAESSKIQVDKSYLIEAKDLGYKQSDLIGSGNFGSVYKGSLYGKEVAVKKFHQQDLKKEALDDLVNEIRILSKLHHPNVVLFIGVCLEAGQLAIVTELMSGSLYSLLHSPSSPPPPLSRRLCYALDACLGMAYLHRPNNIILHRDLKALNLLIDHNGTLKVADFGISRMHLSSGNEEDQMQSYQGSTAWVAPEIFQGKPFTAKADVYSFGVVLWEILTCEIPWQSVNAAVVVSLVSKKNERPPIPESCAPKLRKLIEVCWDLSPENRLNFSDILPELRLCKVESSIFDPEGREFWLKVFSENEEVAFQLFWAQFSKEFRIQCDETSIRCVREVICDPKLEGYNVTVESFSKCLSFFGPLEEGKGQAFAARIRSMLEKEYFHGDIEKEDAVSLLSSHKKGTFLVRFSGTNAQGPVQTLGNYAISLRKKNGTITHIRLTGGGGNVCDNLEKFIKLNKKEIGLKIACPGSKYLKVFSEKDDENEEGKYGAYGYINPVDFSGDSLRVEKKKN